VSDVVRAFAGAAIGGALGLMVLGPFGLIWGTLLGAAYGLGEEPKRSTAQPDRLFPSPRARGEGGRAAAG